MNILALRKAAGFSLIEVLVAVVVLSVGLLALANLQITLMRASADSKSQSVALSLAKDSLEQFRAYDASTDYLSIVGVAQASAVTVAGGDTNYSIWSEVERYAWNKTTSEFELQANLGATLGADYEVGNELKVIKVHVDWTDATGTDQAIELQDALGAVAPENTARVTRKRLDSSNRRPKVIISDPSLDAGVLPIAIGDGSETAATNPRPTIVGNAGDAIKETNYDIFTYAALQGGTAQAQARVETSIVGCRCDFADKVVGATAFRPTFWSGARYTVPKTATYNAPSNEALGAGGKPEVTQSSLCSTCCRDHHDDISGTDGPKFSPKRATHAHFLGGVGTAVTSGSYDEACRLIRVDGFFRVAADPYNEYFNLLETTSEFTLPPPAPTAGDQYEDFVIDYLNAQFTNRSSGYNTSLTEGEDGEATLLAAGLLVADIKVEQADTRWLHSRGLYIDQLETDAVSAINNAKSNCASPLTASECVLRVLPFTSINLTEVSFWKPDVVDVIGSDGSVFNDFGVIAVSNADFVKALTEGTPVRANVQAKGTGVTNASARVRHSASGLIGDESFFINGDEAIEQTNQQFTVVGPNCGGSAPPADNTALGNLRNGDVLESVGECDAISTTAAVILTLELRSSSAQEFDISLVGPDGPDYGVVASTGSVTSYSIRFKPPGVIYEGGKWTVNVTRTSTGGSADVRFRWTIAPVAAEYTVNLLGYSFATATTSYPGIATAPNAVCNWAAGGNPATCSATEAGAATKFTLGSYNYQSGTLPQGLTCTLGDGTGGTPCTVATAPICKNFSVDAASAGGVAATEIAAASGEGTKAESTTMVFAALNDSDVLSITMSEQAPSTPKCVSTGGNAAQFCQANRLTVTCP